MNDVIRSLREREVVHFQRAFGEAVRLAKEKMDQRNVYFTNPAFDKNKAKSALGKAQALSKSVLRGIRRSPRSLGGFPQSFRRHRPFLCLSVHL